MKARRSSSSTVFGSFDPLLRRRWRSLSVAASFALLVSVLSPVGFLTPAANAAVNLTSVQAKVSDHTGTLSDYTTLNPDNYWWDTTNNKTSNCIYYRPSSGSGSGTHSSGWVTSSSEAVTSHGYPSGWDCGDVDDKPNTSRQSAIGVKPRATGNVPDDGTAFPLALVTHYNNPVSSGNASYFTGKFSIQLGGFDGPSPELTYGWNMWETPNGASPCAKTGSGVDNSNGCADQIVFTGQIPDQTLVKNGITYKLVVQGFAPVDGTTCPTTMPTTTDPNFWTKESATTRACIYASLSQVRTLTVVKKVVSSTGAALPTPATQFGFTSESDLAGSPWASGSFNLTPAATSGATASNGPKELLQGETVTVKEAVPSADTWALTDITCLDGQGANVALAEKNLGTGQIKLKATAPGAAAAGPITCTYTNTFTPKATLTLKKAFDGAGTVSDWTLTATGPTTISGKTTQAAVTDARVTAGTYTLGETGPATGYASLGWSCSGATITNGNQITLVNGNTATCTVTNRQSRGKFTIAKEVQGPAGGFVGTGSTPFTGTYTCTPAVAGQPVAFSVTQNTPFTSPEYPANTVCTVTETTPLSQSLLKDSSWSWNAPAYSPVNRQATITDGQTPQVKITNSYVQKTGSLTITKQVAPRTATGAVASDYTGTRTFPIAYDCTIGGTTVKDGTVNLAKGASTTVTGVPATSVCSLSETAQTTQTGDFASPDVAWDGYEVSSGNSVQVTDGGTSGLTLVNYFKRETASLKLAKRVEGSGYTGGSGTHFEVTWQCGTKNGTVDLANGGNTTVSVPARTLCTVQETAPSGNLLPAYEWGPATYEDPDGALTAGVPAGGSKTVTVVNHTVPIFGKVSVTKKIAGESAGVKGDAKFPITVSCPTASYSHTFDLGVNEVGTTPDLPVGTQCTVSEGALTQAQLVDESYAWDGFAITPGNSATVAKDQTKAITVTNTVKRAYGALTVTKVVDGIDGLTGANADFSGTWSCAYGTDPAVTGTWSRTGAGLTTASSHILLTSVCQVTGEDAVTTPPKAGDPSYVWGAAGIGGPVTLTKASPTGDITVTNPIVRTSGAFTVGKTVTGGAAGTAFVDGDFTFHYQCTTKSGEDISGNLTAKAGQTATLPAGTTIPTGSDCVVTETDKPSAKDPYTWDGSSITPNGGAFTIGQDQTVSVVVTNEISQKNVTVDLKKVVDDTTPAGYVGDLSFQLSLVCTLDGATTTYGPVGVKNGATGHLAVPLGSKCTITEVTPAPGAGLKDSSFAWDTPTFSGEQTVASTGGSYTFTATNHVKRVRGDLALTKVLVDPDSVTDPTRTYSGTWKCKRAGDADVSGGWSRVGAGTATLTGVPAGGILLGSTCAPTEAALTAPPSAGDSSYYWDAPGLDDATTSAAGTATMKVTNTVLRHTGKLEVRKVLSGETGGYVATGQQFRVTYTCAAKLPGQGNITGDVKLEAGAAAVTLVDGVPTGWECAVAEDTTSLKQSQLEDASYAWGTTTISGLTNGKVTVASSPATLTVDNEIVRKTGTFGITKAIAAGTPAGVVKPTAAFSGTYTCTYDGQTVKSGTWAVTGAGAATLTPAASGLPATTLCSAEESTPSEAGLVDAGWTWDTPQVSGDVTIADGSTPVITVTNTPTRVYGALSVTKVYNGPAAALKNDAEVTGVWSCSVGSTAAGSGAWTLPAAGGTTQLFGKAQQIPVTAECTVTEDTPSDSLLVDGSFTWKSPVSDPADGRVVLDRDKDKNVVTITNDVQRVRGSFDVAKVVDLPQGVAKATGRTFSGTYTCTYGSDAPVTGSWSVTDEGSTTITGILVESVCGIASENTPAGGPSTDPSYVWNGHSVAPATVKVKATGNPVKLTVTNHTKRITTGLTVTKKLTGATADEPAGQLYAMSYECTDASGGKWTGSKSIAKDEVWTTATDIPLGSTCLVTEGALPDLSPRNVWGSVGFAVTGASGPVDTQGQTATFALPSSAPEAGPSVAAVTVTNTLVRQGSGYTIAKTATPPSGSSVMPGSVIEYKVTVTSTGAGTVDNVGVQDDLSQVVDNAVVSDVSTATGTATVAVDGTSIDWQLGTISGVGTEYTLTYKATVNAGAWGVTLKNQVTPDPDSEQPPTSCITCTTQHHTPHYTLQKAVSPTGPAKPGDVLTYTLTVDNDSQATLPGFTVTDNLSGVLGNATLVTPLDSELKLEDDGTTLTWKHTGDVEPNDPPVTVTYQVTVKDSAWNAVLTNKVTPGPGGECLPGKCETTSGTPHYTLEKSSDQDGKTVMPGDEVTYELKLTNDSDTTLPSFSVTDDLSAVLDNATMVTTLPGNGLSLSGTTLTWSSSTPLAAKDSITVSYKVKVKAGAWNATLKNKVIPGSGGDCVPGKCETSSFTPHFTLEKSSTPVSGSTVMPGDEVTYTLRVTNDSQATLPGFTVVDDLRDVVGHTGDPVVATPHDGTATYDGSTAGAEMLTWTSTTPLAKGDHVELSYTVKVDAGAWDVTLKNVVSPTQGGPGTCVADKCTTTHETPPVTTIRVYKHDAETQDLLKGAEFELYEDKAPVGTLGAEDELIGTKTTGDTGVVEFGEILAGDYLVKETKAPQGYLLPDEPVQVVTVTSRDMGAQAGVPVRFYDQPTGQVGDLVKAQYRFVPSTETPSEEPPSQEEGPSEQPGEWVQLQADDEVAFGDQVKYTLTVPLTGPRLFHGVTLTDYVPGWNPGDEGRTSAKATYVPGSAGCGDDAGVCQASFDDETHLVTWRFDDPVAPGLETKTITVSFAVTFPPLPESPVFDAEGFYRDVNWNEGYLDWQEGAVQPEVLRVVPRLSAAAALAARQRVSNQVTTRATAVAPKPPVVNPPVVTPPVVKPPKVKPPKNLPNTGGPNSAWLYGGVGLVLLGGVLLLSRRPRRTR